MFRNPFSFQGRIRRKEYVFSMLIYWGFLIILSLFEGTEDPAVMMVFLLYLPLIWFLLAQGAKRCHDRNNSGFYSLIPFYGFWMIFADGDAHTNDYGLDPKGREGFEDLIPN